MAEARGGVAKLAKASGLSRENLYKLLSGKRDAMFSTVNIILNGLGLNCGIMSPSRKSRTSRKLQGVKAA